MMRVLPHVLQKRVAFVTKTKVPSPSGKWSLVPIGAGPKGLALAAKCVALDAVGASTPDVVILEADAVGAHWQGNAGFTNGQVTLGTPADKDIGYPYASECFGQFNERVNKEMVAFSWQSFQIESKRYSHWIDTGRPNPTHGEWSEYLQWVGRQVQSHIRIARVSEIDVANDHWLLRCEDTTPHHDSQQTFTLEGHGLVVTGPGEPRRIPGQPDDHYRVVDGRSYWLNRERFTVLPQIRVIIVGTGETAAAIAVDLHNLLDPASRIQIINSQGFIYSRGESFAENKWYSDPKLWSEHSRSHRQTFIRRTDRGVFSPDALGQLSDANIYVEEGRVTDMRVSEKEVLVHVDDDQGEWKSCDFVVVATGFDPVSFTRLLTSNALDELSAADVRWDENRTLDGIGHDLSMTGFRPRLHVPMLAGVAQGPGFPNLSCLGLVSDRILCPYLEVEASHHR